MNQTSSSTTEPTEQDQKPQIKGNLLQHFVSNNRIVLVIVLFAFIFLAVLGLFASRLSSLNEKLQHLEATNTQRLAILSSSGNGAADATSGQLMFNKNLSLVKKISSLMIAVPQLSMTPQVTAQSTLTSQASQTTPKSNTSAKSIVPANAEAKWWRAVSNQIAAPVLNFFKDLVKIQVVDDAEVPAGPGALAMSPASQAMVRQELKMHLMAARQFVLFGTPEDAVGDLAESRALTLKNFSAQSPEVISFMANLQQLEAEIKTAPSALSDASSIPTIAGKK